MRLNKRDISEMRKLAGIPAPVAEKSAVADIPKYTAAGEAVLAEYAPVLRDLVALTAKAKSGYDALRTVAALNSDASKAPAMSEALFIAQAFLGGLSDGSRLLRENNKGGATLFKSLVKV